MDSVKRRRSIHQDGKSNKEADVDKDVEELPMQCNKCKKYFTKSGSTYNEQSEENMKKWLAIKKSNMYPDLSKIVLTDVCNICDPALNSTSSDKLDSVGKKSYFKMITSFLTGLVVLVAYATAKPAFDKWMSKEVSFPINQHKVTAFEEYFDKALSTLEEKYSKQDENVWFTLSGGIKYVPKHNPNRPSVFMFLYDSEAAGSTAKCLAQEASYLASAFLKKDKERTPVILSGQDLNTARLIGDPGMLLVDYNRTLQDNGAMVITNLQDVHWEVARSLHFFCDAYSPLVETAAYIFTLKVDSVPESKRTSTARNKLNELWSDKMPHGTIEALITRITPNVLGIVSDTTDC